MKDSNVVVNITPRPQPWKAMLDFLSGATSFVVVVFVLIALCILALKGLIYLATGVL